MNCNHCGTELDKYEWCPALGCQNARRPMSALGESLFIFAATQSALRFAETQVIRPVEVEEGKATA